MDSSLSEIKEMYNTPIRVKPTRLADIRSSLAIRSSTDLRVVTTLLKQVCRYALIDLNRRSTCMAKCQSTRKDMGGPDSWCGAHERRINEILSRPDDSDQEPHHLWDEIEKCDQCNQSLSYPEPPDCARTCGSHQKSDKQSDLVILADQLSTRVGVDADWLLFLVWYCYTYICPKKMLTTAGVLEWFLLSRHYEQVLYNERRSYVAYTQRFLECPLTGEQTVFEH
jgi:hypothetical protein